MLVINLFFVVARLFKLPIEIKMGYTAETIWDMAYDSDRFSRGFIFETVRFVVSMILTNFFIIFAYQEKYITISSVASLMLFIVFLIVVIVIPVCWYVVVVKYYIKKYKERKKKRLLGEEETFSYEDLEDDEEDDYDLFS